jgi:hypothetical protein
MTTEELAKKTGFKGRALGGAPSAFAQIKNKEWLVRRKARKIWEFNDKYRTLIRDQGVRRMNYPMEAILAVLLSLAFALPSFAELTKQDVEQIIRQELEPIKLDIAEMKGKMATKDDIIAVQRTLTIALVTVWITIIAAIITIPYLYGRADRERVRQLEADIRELQKLKSEFETFKALTETMEALREKARQVLREKPELAEDLRTIGLL